MIKEVSGDILLSKAALIAHGVAPGDHFDSGLALSLREEWPAMYKDFRHFCQVGHPSPGALWVWSGVSGRIACLFTQEAAQSHSSHPGKASVANVNHALRELRKLIDKEKIASVALPRLATGVGGLSWDQVKPLIVHHLGDLEIPVYVYSEYHKGIKAES